MKGISKKEQTEILANKIKLLFGFCAEFIPDIELLRETLLGAKNKEDYTLSAAPILGAFGIDYEEKNWEWRMRRERAEALVNLVEVLKRTEEERAKMKTKKSEMSEIVKLFNL